MPPKYRLKRLTFTDEQGNEHAMDLCEYERAELMVEVGIAHIPKRGISELHPNGHRRVTIRAWSGFENWDDFRTD